MVLKYMFFSCLCCLFLFSLLVDYLLSNAYHNSISCLFDDVAREVLRHGSTDITHIYKIVYYENKFFVEIHFTHQRCCQFGSFSKLVSGLLSFKFLSVWPFH